MSRDQLPRHRPPRPRLPRHLQLGNPTRPGLRRRGPLRGPGIVSRAYGRTIVAAARTQPYGESIHARAYLTHAVDVVYHAWMRGRLVGTLVRWACGSMTPHYRLTAEPTRPLCPLCVAAIGRTTGFTLILTDGATP